MFVIERSARWKVSRLRSTSMKHAGSQMTIQNSQLLTLM